jgi:two-component system response regulator YesN
MYRLLIVDDEYEIRRSLALFFPWGETGFVVAGQAENGKIAQDFVKENPVDAVLCDIKMPLVSGLEFARWARQQGYVFRIVFLSAYRKFDFAQEALRYGVKSYMVKPPDFPALRACFMDIKRELDAETDRLAAVDDVIETVKTYIEGSLAGATIREAAGLVGMNSHYLSSYIRQRTGQTFTQHLSRRKMEHAATMLRDRRNSVVDVSAALGYTSPKNFSRAFRRFFGVSPGRFRRPKPA